MGVKLPQKSRIGEHCALRHAQWMSIILNTSKKHLLSDQIGYEKEYVDNLEIFLQFTTIANVPVWLKGRLVLMQFTAIFVFGRRLKATMKEK